MVLVIKLTTFLKCLNAFYSLKGSYFQSGSQLPKAAKRTVGYMDYS